MKGSFLHKLSSNKNAFSLIREKVKRIGIHSGNLIVGDTVMLNPLARSLRDSLPGTQIDHIGVVQPFVKEFCRKVLPVDNFIQLELKGIGYVNIPVVMRAIGKIKTQNYDLIVDNQLVFLNSLILKCSRKQSLISLTAGGLLSDYDLPEAKNRPTHLIDRSVSPLRTLGFPVVYNVPSITVEEKEKIRIAKILDEKGIGPDEILIGMAPYSSHLIKDWPVENFKSLINLTLGNGYDRVILFASASDLDRLKRDFPSNEKILYSIQIDPESKSIDKVFSLMSRLSLFVGNDSGLSHVAGGIGVPLIAIFGPTSPIRFGPRGKQVAVMSVEIPCRPCRYNHSCKQDRECLKSIKPESVLETSIDLLNKSGKHQAN